MSLKFMCIGAHPDDADFGFGGTAIKLAKAGHIVQFVSVTDGQSGHHEIPGNALVRTRYNETQEARKRLGIDSYVVLDNRDGYLTADIPAREGLMKAIREFGPDYIFTHRPNDYHPDHRSTGQLVQDCSFLVRVPNFLPGVPVPDVMPVIFYMCDNFMKPLPIDPAIVVDIDDVIEAKQYGVDAHVSQVYEWLPWIGGYAQDVPKDPAARLEFLKKTYGPRWAGTANRFRGKLIEKYGQAHGSKVQYTEAFEDCEYGGPHNAEREKELFTF